VPDIVVSEFMDAAALKGFPEAWRLLYDPGLVDDRERLFAELAGARAIIVRNRTRVDADLLAAAPKLLAVGRLGVGLDNIDLDACEARGVAVLPATGANTLSVAEYVISAALQLTRGAYSSNAAMIAGEWPRSELIGGELSGRTMGLVGFGHIARAVAERARSLGMDIAAFDPFVADDDPVWDGVEQLSSLDQLLERCDVVSLHVPLTPRTKNLIAVPELARMKAGAILINTARGGVVDEAALADSLKAGKLGGAALDVFETEPLTAEAGEKFNPCRNIILTPHIAGVTAEANVRVSYLTVENVRRVLENLP